MKKKIKKELISIIITNFNKEKYLEKTLISIFKQDYRNYEVIIFDDCSTDNSLKIINKYKKKLKLIKNKKKRYNSGPLNQISGIIQAFKKSNGKIICLLDSDDRFEKKKLSKINNFFQSNIKKNFVVNFIKGKSNFFFKRIKASEINWPTIFPTSCISFRKSFFKSFVKKIKLGSFPNLEVDARLIMYAYHSKKDFNLIYDQLTQYITSNNNISSNYIKFSKNWWLKRKEAFDYLQYILKTKNISFLKSFDYIATNIICLFFYLVDKNR